LGTRGRAGWKHLRRGLKDQDMFAAAGREVDDYSPREPESGSGPSWTEPLVNPQDAPEFPVNGTQKVEKKMHLANKSTRGFAVSGNKKARQLETVGKHCR